MSRSDARRHILFLIPTLTAGGAERVIVTLLRHLNRTQFRLTLGVVDLRKEVFLNDVPDDVAIVDLNCSRVRYALPKIILLIWKMRPDVVLSTLGHLNLALAIFRAWLPRQTFTLARETIVVSRGIQRYINPSLWKWMYLRFYSNHDMVICQSKDMFNDLVENFAFPRDKALIIHNPIDVAYVKRASLEDISEIDMLKSGLDSQLIQLVAAGRLVEQKGFDLAIEAMALLDHPMARLTILGDGPLKRSLEQLAKHLGVSDKIRFVGFQANPYAWFVRADAFLFSSRYEGFPNVVLEALACRKPVIATPAPGGTQEILQGIPGCFLADEVSSEALVSAIRQWLNSSKEDLAEGVVERYNVATITERYEKLFNLAGGHHKQ